MARIHEKRPNNLLYLKKEAILDHLLKTVHPGDLVLTLGAGDITYISDELVRKLEERLGISGLPPQRVRSSDEIKGLGTIGVIMGGPLSPGPRSLGPWPRPAAR